MATMDPVEVVARVLEGFICADRRYEQMFGGWRLHVAPESLATVTIGQRVAKEGHRHVTLEQNILDAMRWSGGGFEGSADLSSSGRFDVAVWGPGTDGIHGVIEVKLGAWFTYADVAPCRQPRSNRSAPPPSLRGRA